MSARVSAMFAAIMAGAALAGPYDQPWSQVESGDRSDVRKESRLSISKIDGESLRTPRRSEALAPGKHVITVRYESAAGAKNEPSRQLEMDLEPCTRYRIVAKYQSSMTGKWEPKVYSEPITECVAKFKTAKGKAT